MKMKKKKETIGIGMLILLVLMLYLISKPLSVYRHNFDNSLNGWFDVIVSDEGLPLFKSIQFEITIYPTPICSGLTCPYGAAQQCGLWCQQQGYSSIQIDPGEPCYWQCIPGGSQMPDSVVFTSSGQTLHTWQQGQANPFRLEIKDAINQNCGDEMASYSGQGYECTTRISLRCSGACNGGYSVGNPVVVEKEPVTTTTSPTTTIVQCSSASDCEGYAHIECVGHWECQSNSCVWICDYGEIPVVALILIGGLGLMIIKGKEWLR